MSGVKKPVNQAKIKAVPDFCPIIKTQAANGRLNERLLPPKIPSKQPKAAKMPVKRTAITAHFTVPQNIYRYGS